MRDGRVEPYAAMSLAVSHGLEWWPCQAASEGGDGVGQGLWHLRPAIRPGEPEERIPEGAVPLVSPADIVTLLSAASDISLTPSV